VVPMYLSQFDTRNNSHTSTQNTETSHVTKLAACGVNIRSAECQKIDWIFYRRKIMDMVKNMRQLEKKNVVQHHVYYVLLTMYRVLSIS